LSYGLALLIHSYGFLSVFAAGLALRRIERQQSRGEPPHDVRAAAESGEEEAATDPEKAHAYMAQAVLAFNERLERIGEVAMVLILGAMLTTVAWTSIPLWFLPLVFLVVRPIATFASLPGSPMRTAQRTFVAWFGVRGVGSLYYLTFAIAHGVVGPEARQVADLVLAAVAVSIVVHGVSVTPLMKWYSARLEPTANARGTAASR
jgi:NhaP-type Na+/H+ or K+/H+ antiporter